MATQAAEQFKLRHATLDDIPAVVELRNICSMEETGKPETDEARMRTRWCGPNFDPGRQVWLVQSPEGQLVGYGGVWHMPPHVRYWTWCTVHPDFRGQGIGTRLLNVTEDYCHQNLSQAPDGTRVIMMRGANKTNPYAPDLFPANGYAQIRYDWFMVIDLNGVLPEPTWADGVRVRTFVPERDLEAVYDADNEFFKDHWGYIPTPREDGLKQWQHWIENDPDFDPDVWFLAVTGEGDDEQIVGISLCAPKMAEDADMAYVESLAVRREFRRKGIGLALLHHTFQAFAQRGNARVALHVDAQSLTGATRLYERAGMHVEREYHDYEKELRAGQDLSTQTLSE
ncbi:MAG: GNAT family N-acetyltransferase [Chloroflexi bacterium]|nr:GNAT family N-acetyltransferase [Chloroflexota bacterium]